MPRLVALVAAAFALTAAPALAAQTWTVTRTDDPAGPCVYGSSCSLRQAIAAAAAGDTVVVPAGATPYTVTNVISFSKNLTISGAGARTTTISGGGTTQVFDLGSVGTPTIAINGVTITAGHLSGSNAFGGGLLLESGTYMLSDMAIVGNTAESTGNSIGGGLATASATVTLTRVLVANNTATGSAASFGGGIGNGATLTILDSTIAGNHATGPGTAQGGGISAGSTSGAKVTITGSTIAANSAKQGGNINGNVNGGGYIKLLRTIIADGVASTANPNCMLAAGAFTSLGDNIDSLNECGLAAGEKRNTNPLLGALGDHGGPSDTMTLGAGSPAIRAAADCTSTSSSDQRGLGRPGVCSIGAYEPQTPVLSMGADPGTAQVGQTIAFSATPSDDDGDAGTPQWTFDDGATASGAAVQHAFATAGSHTATATVSDAAGLSTSGMATVSVLAPGELPPGDGPAPIVADRTAPVITGLKLTRTAFRRSTRVRLTLSEAATLTTTVQRRGRKTFVTLKGATARKLAAGARTWVFAGRVRGKRLKPGRYRLVLRAVDAAGNRSKVARVAFRIV